jgi:uncharacterized membrane protein
MQRFVAPRAPTVAAIAWIAGFAVIAIDLTHLLSGRAAFLHVGAMLGTIMAGNVFFTIVPSQRELVASVAGGQPSESAAMSARAKRVSIHNNYFTFPVIALMVSSHFPTMYGHRWNWVILIVIVVAGAAVRHLLNIRWVFPQWKPALAVTMVASVGVLYALMVQPASITRSASAGAVTAPAIVTFADVRHVIDRRCAACHSMQPADSTFGAAPAGVAFDTPEQIVARAARIKERAVATRTMPPGNKTHITEMERAILARWIELGSPSK